MYDTISLYEYWFKYRYRGCLIEAKEPNIPDYLPIAEGRRVRFMPFVGH